MSSPAGRLLDVLSLLQARPHWTAPELAERLGVTERTVRRDVTRLRGLGYPVEAAFGPDGGYQLGAGGVLPPLLLTDDEAVAVAVGLRATAVGGVTGFDEAAVAALAKLDQVLPARLREQVRALTTSTELVQRGDERRVDPELLLRLAQGCRAPERVRFAYTAGDGTRSERRVEPYRLVNVERRWYLVAHDLDRGAWRTFRLDRMADVALTGHRFVRTEEPDAARMVSEGITMAVYDTSAVVRLPVPLAEAAAEIGPTVGSLEAVDETTTLLRLGGDAEWIAGYLAGLPWDVEVVEPPEVVAALRALARRLLRIHR